MTPNQPRLVAIVLIVATAMIQYALLPSPDIALPATVHFLLGLAQVGLVTLATALNLNVPAAKP